MGPIAAGVCNWNHQTLMSNGPAVLDNPHVQNIIWAVGLFTVIRFLWKTIGMFLHTFVLPGTSVSAAACSLAAEQP